jgi:predicted phosphodiesterase
MRYGILSDIHSNLDALDAVLKELDQEGLDQLVCLGDIVGYGPNPNECCDVLRQRNCLAIAGNHDEAAASTSYAEKFNSLAAAAIAWTRNQLTTENRSFLMALPRERHFDTFDIVHGAPGAHFDYVLGITDACNAFQHVHKPITFIGHTHVAEVFFQEALRRPSESSSRPSGRLDEFHMLEAGRTFHQRLANGGRIEVTAQFRYIINPGSVGQPRDRNPQASFARYDEGANVIEIRRVTYDVTRVREKMERVDLPPELAERLSLGY